MNPDWMQYLSNMGMKRCKPIRQVIITRDGSERVIPDEPVKRKFKIQDRASIFLTGFIQVSLVSAQTYMVARSIYQGVFIIGFLISLVWSVNVKKIAFGGWIDRIIYSVGAGVGAVVGLCVAVAFARK